MERPFGLGSSELDSGAGAAENIVKGKNSLSMGKASRPFLLTCVVFLLLGWARSQPAQEAILETLPPPDSKRVDFDSDVAPLFKEKCQSCHGPEKQMGGLRLDTQDEAMAGGYSGPVILPGKSAESKLIHMLAGVGESLIMPVGGEPLTGQQIGLVRAWIDQGAAWTDQITSSETDSGVQTKRDKHPHWAFNPPQRAPVPEVRDAGWVRNPIDAFVLARLESQGITASPEAERITLMRRASLDLTGLPPTPHEVDRFLADEPPGAYERLVDRLLDSPHYGEKWARHWMDLARYADSDGYESDFLRPHAWRWRHWLIDALNQNMPFDRFTIEQMAGDLLPDATLKQLVAAGYNRNTLTDREGGFEKEMDRVEQVMDRAENLGSVWLGLTVGCARCHDHKYDPISQKDYYQLYAFFNTAREINVEAALAGEMGPFIARKAEYDRRRQQLLENSKVLPHVAEWEQKTRAAGADLDAADPVWRQTWNVLGIELDYAHETLMKDPSERSQKEQERLTDYILRHGAGVKEERRKELKLKELREKLAELKKEIPALSEAQTLEENPVPPKSYLLVRGDYKNPGIEVGPEVPAVLPRLPEGSEPLRLRLARWLVSHENPLTARVTVNRIWQELFGRGLVETSEDFGTRGEPPTHPKLLDWLAVEFMDSGWDVKSLQKLMLTSGTYRQSSDIRKDLEERDPDNGLWARQTRFRLPAELVRDVTLAASGLLNPTIGGRSIRPPQPAGMSELGLGGEGRDWEVSQGSERYRRGLYILFRRTTPYPQLATFDAPDSFASCSRRERSTTPLQALILLNDPVFFEAARGLAARILRETPGSFKDRIDYAFRLCLARSPSSAEREDLLAYYRQKKQILAKNPELVEKLFPPQSVEGADPSEASAWVGLSSVLLNLDEFITRE